MLQIPPCLHPFSPLCSFLLDLHPFPPLLHILLSPFQPFLGTSKPSLTPRFVALGVRSPKRPPLGPLEVKIQLFWLPCVLWCLFSAFVCIGGMFMYFLYICLLVRSSQAFGSWQSHVYTNSYEFTRFVYLGYALYKIHMSLLCRPYFSMILILTCLQYVDLQVLWIMFCLIWHV